MKIPFDEKLVVSEQTIPFISQFAECIPGGFFIYKLDDEREFIYFNSKIWKMLGCESEDEFRDFTKNSFKNAIYPDDYEYFMSYVKNNRKTSHEDIEHLKIRVIRKDGTIGMFEGYGYYSHSEDFGEIYYVFVQDISEQYKVDSLNSVISKMSEELVFLAYMYPDTGLIDIFQINEEMINYDHLPFRNLSYDDQIKQFADRYVLEADRKMYLRCMDKKNLIENVGENKDVRIHFRLKNMKRHSVRWFELKAVFQRKYTGEGCILIGIRDINDVVDREIKREEAIKKNDKKLAEYNFVNKMFAGTYTAICLVNLKSHEYKIMSMNKETEDMVKKFVPENADVYDAVYYLLATVHDEDKMKLQYISQNLNELLDKNNGFYRTNVRWIYSDGNYYLTEINLYRDPEDHDIMVAGFRNIHDSESQKTAISDCVKIFTDNEDFDDTLNNMLAVAADYYKADRAYVFEESTDGILISNTHEWCRKDVESQMDCIQNTPKKYISDLYKSFEKKGAFSLDCKNIPGEYSKDLKERLESLGIKSLVAAPVISQDKIFGFIGVDNPVYAKNETRVLSTAASLTADLIIKTRQKHLEEKRRLEQKRNTEIIEILASEFSSVYYIDLEADSLTAYAMNDHTAAAFDSVGSEAVSYSDTFRRYVDNLVFPEDRTMMMKAGSLGNIMKELKSKKTFITTFRDSDGRYCEMKFVKVGKESGVPVAVALGFADKDLEIRTKMEESRILQRNIDIIEILASEYSSVYYIDLASDEIDPYTMNEQTEGKFGKIFRNGIKFSAAFKLYVNTLVFEDDREIVLNAGSLYNILKELSFRKSFSTIYRNDEGEYCEMKFVKVGDDENPQAVALGFANKNKEISEKFERDAASERDAAVISGLSVDFGCVFYADYDTKEEIQYRSDPFFEKHIPGWSEIKRFDERMLKLINTIMHPDDRKPFMEAASAAVIRKALEKEKVYYVNFRTLIDDEITYYQAKFVRDENSVNHAIAGFHNIDDEMKRELAALDRAESANRAKTAFLFNMSHDIRTPMNAIIGYTNIAKKCVNDPEKVLDSLEKVKLSSDMLLALINDILDMSRIESGRAVLKEDRADIVKIFNNIDPVMSTLASSKNIDLTFNVGKVDDRFVYADLARLERILVNIISNAVKYTAVNGFVKVSVSQTECDKEEYRKYTFAVQDNGIGMSEEFQSVMFEEFSREENSTTSGIPGTGLGLPLAKKLTQMMNGSIACVSKQGVGSTFVITIPFRLQTDTDMTELNSTNIHNRKIDFLGKKVLLAEDNDLNSEIAIDILESEGMIVERAANGLEAVNMIGTCGRDFFDFILMDIQMPVMDGYTATRLLRKEIPDLRAPIIALSANAFEEDRQKSIEAGMNDHVAKPICIDDLKSALEKYM